MFSDDCNCPKVVLIHLNLTDAQADSFCPRCLCKYQTRSLAIIKVVVILVVWVVLLLLFYMAFLSILEPILSKKRCAGLPGLDRNISYREHHDATESGITILFLHVKSEAKKTRHVQKLAIDRKSTFFVHPHETKNLMVIITF